ncbi:uncharacterized protein [Rutidosis leptorrhynchoides]|uniref:uncharacterized protein n=1 Tax=Rutidosis leptorrhynchoides TaxID=125765 RepID=UPI003A993A67
MEFEKGNASSVVMMREYRKGNWTLEETMVLIEAKRLDEQRRMHKNNTGTHSNAQSTTIIRPSGGELKWKWIEEHCWKNGCFRSQNQCNDKWDNLMRDFKKIREFERRILKINSNDHNHDLDEQQQPQQMSNNSYWKMDKIERKNNNLPSNMLPQIYHTLAHILEAKMDTSSIFPTVAFHPSNTIPPPQPPVQPLAYEESSTKRRRPSDDERSISEEISASSSVLIEAIKGYEIREEARHKELYSLLQKRYEVEESKIELERQGFKEIVDAINNLSNSILAFTSQRNQL